MFRLSTLSIIVADVILKHVGIGTGLQTRILPRYRHSHDLPIHSLCDLLPTFILLSHVAVAVLHLHVSCPLHLNG